MAKVNPPNFFIIGAAKAATTSLSSLLEQHPQAAIVQGKEPHFFSYDQFYQLGWNKYLQLFNHCHGQKAIGDASTSYSRIRYHPVVVDRIRQHVPNAKIIYMVRHPLERMKSAYVEHLCTRGGLLSLSINDAIRKQPMIIDSSRYWEVFEAYRKRYAESQIKIIWFEEYTTNTTAVFQDVCRFLELDDTIVPDFKKERTNNRDLAGNRLTKLGRENITINTNWDEAIRQWVIKQILEDNMRFLRHFGKPRDYWSDLF